MVRRLNESEGRRLWLIDVLTQPAYGIGIGKGMYYNYTNLYVKYEFNHEVFDAVISMTIDNIGVYPSNLGTYFVGAKVQIKGKTLLDDIPINVTGLIVFNDKLFLLDHKSTLFDIIEDYDTL